MTTSTQPTRKAARDSRGHLSLVPPQYDPNAQPEEAAPEPGTPAERLRVVPRGSATVRALIALGALMSGLFYPQIGKQLAAFNWTPQEPDKHKDESEPRPDETPAATTTPTPTKSPTVKAQKTADRWTPARNTVAIRYRDPAPAPTGRHRKANTEQHTPDWRGAGGNGRHRRSSIVEAAPTPAPKPAAGPDGCVEVTLSIPVVDLPIAAGL